MRTRYFTLEDDKTVLPASMKQNANGGQGRTTL